ncbi:MAG: tRNA (uridine(34)/cytosine(34)/5-carboxymethylaminomethyluridine(34)-2'-O)-methyltransferase TrmL [Polyangiaceae bacterium UTPRO1]|jgi:tRNA (cytidine/uridine-2'-O-)-methyltransferase|nr:tRNA (cytidine(34)-2'-O)-methyltransferase [Myxococcales bacterium]OQY65970.1 MAG: tRNA (uridine(34)/cytosine(34)/5-carboxymethylaminomethyluridine(34)-2'-O)-methyltransferase TrmL [Polyangiaceae bacterium UTPRO1]
MHVALVEPEIPPNTGSIARLCAATGTPLHLIGRLGFSIDDKQLKRAGLDYWPYVDVRRHADWAAFAAAVPGRRLGFSARATRLYTEAAYAPDDVLVFGCETRGLPPALKEELAAHLYAIPITSQHVRSLNLATAVAVVLYEAIRQTTGR